MLIPYKRTIYAGLNDVKKSLRTKRSSVSSNSAEITRRVSTGRPSHAGRDQPLEFHPELTDFDMFGYPGCN